ncbi:MAG: IS110 family transposase [Caldilineaceae bacterium]|nr:IS110 family transposase [Caldilineaceae bacterium]
MRTIESVVAVGWDSHRKFSQVTLRDAEARVVERRRIEHADRDAMRAVLAAWPAGTPVVLEASFGWDWISDELAAAGHEPQLARSTTMAAWRKTAGRAKSNRLDADLLSEAPFEKRSGWRVWLPPVKVRERRELLRHRIALLQIQTMLKNRIHALLHRAGVLHAFSDLFGVAGRRFLQLLAAGEDPRLRPAARETLLCELQLLDQVRWHVARATREFRRQVQASPAAELLRTLPGVSWILAYTLLAEIGEIDRFRSGRNLASYALLAPVADDSGDDDGSSPKGRRVGWIGRATLKWAFIEAAHIAARCDARFREIFNRRTDNGRCDRGRGYVAVARHLAMTAAAMWRHGQAYSPTPPARPGSRPGRRSTASKTDASNRPGTGQPEHPVAPAASPRQAAK